MVYYWMVKASLAVASVAASSGDTALLDRSMDTFLSEEPRYPPATLAGSIAELAGSVMVSEPPGQW
jgi:hypothetical protein